MAETLSTFRARITEKIPNVNTDELTNDQKDANLTQALSEYSRLRPLEKVVDTNADGSNEYDLPSGWIADFSIFLSIEFPAGTSQDPKDDEIAPENYGVYKNDSESKLRFYANTPTSGTIRQKFTIKHSVTADASTVLDNDFDAVTSRAASLCCFDLARYYAQDTSSTLSADSVDRQGKSEKYASLGRGLLKEFAVHMGLGENTVVAGVSIKNFDLEYPGGQDFLTHPTPR